MVLYRCSGGHFYFHAHKHCPLCEGRLLPVACRGTGILLCHTKIETAPGGIPVVLGIARHESGAKTLCRVVGDVRGTGNERIFMIDIEGMVYVHGRGTRKKPSDLTLLQSSRTSPLD